MAWFNYVVLSLGIVYVVTESAIAAPLRMAFARTTSLAGGLIYCRACFGFWVGLATSGIAPHGVHNTFVSGLCIMLLGYAWSRVWPNVAFDIEQLPPTPGIERVERERAEADEDA